MSFGAFSEALPDIFEIQSKYLSKVHNVYCQHCPKSQNHLLCWANFVDWTWMFVWSGYKPLLPTFFPPHLNPLSPLTSLYQCNFFSSVPLRHLFLSFVLTQIASLNCFINAFIFHYSIFYFVHKPGHAEPSADFRIRYPSGQSSFGNVNCLDTLDTKPCSQRLVSCSKGCAV